MRNPGRMNLRVRTMGGRTWWDAVGAFRGLKVQRPRAVTAKADLGEFLLTDGRRETYWLIADTKMIKERVLRLTHELPYQPHNSRTLT